MRDLVLHPRSGLLLDFAEENFGGDEQQAIIADWYERRQAGRKPLVDEGEFICHVHRNRDRPWLYLRQRDGLLIAAHWRNTGLAGSHEIVHGVSDEHKRQVDYLQRAGETAGFEVKREVALATKVRSDAVIYGTQVQMGVEVQRSGLTATAAKARTTKARHAGIEPVWFSDSRSDPRWLGHVPGIRMNPEVPWDTLPGQRSVSVVSGVRVLVPKQCQDIRNGQCPQRRYGCTEWHPDHEPRLNTFVDDLAELVPAGELVPILYRTSSDREQVLILSKPDKARYESMIGAPADVPLRQRIREQFREGSRIDCVADAGGFVQSLRCPEHGIFLIENVPGKHYCRLCHQRHMNAKASPTTPFPSQ